MTVFEQIFNELQQGKKPEEFIGRIYYRSQLKFSNIASVGKPYENSKAKEVKIRWIHVSCNFEKQLTNISIYYENRVTPDFVSVSNCVTDNVLYVNKRDAYNAYNKLVQDAIDDYIAKSKIAYNEKMNYLTNLFIK